MYYKYILFVIMHIYINYKYKPSQIYCLTELYSDHAESLLVTIYKLCMFYLKNKS